MSNFSALSASPREISCLYCGLGAPLEESLMHPPFGSRPFLVLPALTLLIPSLSLAAEKRIYTNRLTPIAHPKPLLADHSEFIEPIREIGRFEAPNLVNDKGGNLHVRAWRFSYNARGIIEMPNRLRAERTAL